MAIVVVCELPARTNGLGVVNDWFIIGIDADSAFSGCLNFIICKSNMSHIFSQEAV